MNTKLKKKKMITYVDHSKVLSLDGFLGTLERSDAIGNSQQGGKHDQSTHFLM